jgi:hypothetical protein
MICSKGPALTAPAGSAAELQLPLQGVQILIMDDESIIALDLQYLLQDAGATIVGPATPVSDALRLIQSTASPRVRDKLSR